MEGLSLGVDGSGSVYLTGNFQAASLTTPALARIGNRDAFAMKLDASGAQQWAMNYGGNNAITTSASIAVDGTGNIFLGGYFAATGSLYGDFSAQAVLTSPPLTAIGRQDAFIIKQATVQSAPMNYTALWWNPNESGWGINLNHQGDIVFGTLFTYDAAGAPLWLVMPAGRLQAGTSIYAGDLYRTTGPAFNANPFTPIGEANLTKVGTLSIGFTGADSATLNYTVNGVAVGKSIQKQVFGQRAANCVPTSGSRAAITNYQDLWWNLAESGWGVNVTHQDQILFATLFTYDATGRDLWLVMSAGQRQADGSYLGDLFRTTGPPFNASPFTPIGAGNVTTVGTMRFRFTDGNTGTLAYAYQGVAVTKQVTRQVFSSPVPACS
jgi:hypothetical protein